MELTELKPFFENNIVLEAINSDMPYDEFIWTLDRENPDEEKLIELYSLIEIINITCDEPWVEEWDEEYVEVLLSVDWTKVHIGFTHIMWEIQNELQEISIVL